MPSILPDTDAELLASLGGRCLRVPFNNRHFMDDMELDVVGESIWVHEA